MSRKKKFFLLTQILRHVCVPVNCLMVPSDKEECHEKLNTRLEETPEEVNVEGGMKRQKNAIVVII